MREPDGLDVEDQALHKPRVFRIQLVQASEEPRGQPTSCPDDHFCNPSQSPSSQPRRAAAMVNMDEEAEGDSS